MCTRKAKDKTHLDVDTRSKTSWSFPNNETKQNDASPTTLNNTFFPDNKKITCSTSSPTLETPPHLGIQRYSFDDQRDLTSFQWRNSDDFQGRQSSFEFIKNDHCYDTSDEEDEEIAALTSRSNLISRPPLMPDKFSSTPSEHFSFRLQMRPQRHIFVDSSTCTT